MIDAAQTSENGLALDSYTLVQDFTPLSHSRLWSLNEDYWNASGMAAFFQDSVPYVATNDGSLAEATLQVLTEYAQGVQTLTIVEIGPGSGIFAQAVITGYAKQREKIPSLPAMKYMFVDCSESMLDTLQHGLAPLADLCEMSFLLGGFPAGPDLRSALMQSISPQERALCIANYALDSLAAAMVCAKDNQLNEVEVEIRDLPGNAATGPRDIGSLLIRARVGDQPYTGVAAALVKASMPENGQYLPVNSGAMETLAFLSKFEDRFGGVLVNDYSVEPGAAHFEPFQYFGSSVAIGLNFDLLDRFIENELGWTVARPKQPNDQIVSRLYVQDPCLDLQTCFADVFSLQRAKRVHEYMARARTARRAGQKGRALSLYQGAMNETGENWSLFVELGEFILNAMNDTDKALALAQRAIMANPYATEAYNLMGECKFNAGDIGAARQSYNAVLTLKPDDPRGLLNLAYCDARDGDLAAGLGHIAQALASDRDGTLTSELLERQRELIERVQSKR